MFNTLRARFILSHILPLLIVIPILGIAIIYLVENQFLTPALLSELQGNALMLSRLVERDTTLWQDPKYASDLLGQVPITSGGRLVLLDPSGHILASSAPVNPNFRGTRFEHPELDELAAGQVAVSVRYSRYFGEDIADALVPVTSQDGQRLGFIDLSYRYATFTDELYRLRFLLTGLLLTSLLLGAGIGILLAVNIEAPVQRITEAVDALADGESNKPLPEQGASEIRRLAHSVNTLLERLTNLESSRKRLLANLVHEIGRPLGALRMGIEALGQGAERDPQFYGEMLAGMSQETSRLQRLLEELSHLQEQTLGELELNFESIDLCTWLPQTLATWKQAAMRKQLNWNISLPSVPLTLQADPLRLGQVLGNLVSNAIKFTPENGSITVEAGEKQDQVWISVSDTGTGILPTEQEKIFNPFVRGGHGKRFPQGMGLGLGIARDIVEAHGGKLTLESKPGLGSKFTVWLNKNAHIQESVVREI